MATTSEPTLLPVSPSSSTSTSTSSPSSPSSSKMTTMDDDNKNNKSDNNEDNDMDKTSSSSSSERRTSILKSFQEKTSSLRELEHKITSPNPKSSFEISWRILMGIIAALEFFSVLLQSNFFAQTLFQQNSILFDLDNNNNSNNNSVDSNGDINSNSKNMFGLWNSKSQQQQQQQQYLESTGEEALWEDILEWIAEHESLFDTLLSIMWIFSSLFLFPYHRRRRALERKDKQNLLSTPPTSTATTSTEKTSTKEEEEEEEDLSQGYAKGEWGVYIFWALASISLLPVGFFYLQWNDYLTLFMGGQLQSSQPSTTSTSNNSNNNSNSSDVPVLIMTKQTKYCLAYVLWYYTWTSFQYGTTSSYRLMKEAMVRMGIRKMAKFAIRNPRRFRKRLMQTLRTLRWVKYLAPLIGTGNKLFGNTMDLLKKTKQHFDAQRAAQIKRRLWTKLAASSEECRQKAALRIQSKVRQIQHQKKVRALQYIQLQTQDIAILKLQSILRERAKRAREVVKKKKKELYDLQMKRRQLQNHHHHHHHQNNNNSSPSSSNNNNRDDNLDHASHLNPNERRRLYQLESELHIQVQSDKWKSMLLRPNTKFAVTWKIVFVFCVIIEITQLAMIPQLKKKQQQQQQRNGNGGSSGSGSSSSSSVGFGHVLEEYWIPKTMINEWPTCAPYYPKTKNNIIEQKKRNPTKFMKQMVVFGMDRIKKTTTTFFNTNNNKNTTIQFNNNTTTMHTRQQLLLLSSLSLSSLSRPWYCYSFILTLQQIYIYSIRFIIHETLFLISLICFLDVFITFFTGELDPNNGCLVPKPFWTRWLLPGLMLQLLVNPKMMYISWIIKCIMDWIHNIGPARVWRWNVVWIGPMMKWCWNWMEWNVWRRLVYDQNHK